MRLDRAYAGEQRAERFIEEVAQGSPAWRVHRRPQHPGIITQIVQQGFTSCASGLTLPKFSELASPDFALPIRLRK